MYSLRTSAETRRTSWPKLIELLIATSKDGLAWPRIIAAVKMKLKKKGRKLRQSRTPSFEGVRVRCAPAEEGMEPGAAAGPDVEEVD